jgi:hypothetical protein
MLNYKIVMTQKHKKHEILGNNQESLSIETTLMSLINVYCFKEKKSYLPAYLFLSAYLYMFEPYTFF